MHQPNSKQSPLSRRNFVLCGLTAAVTGCSELPLVSNAYSALRLATFGLPDSHIDRALVSQIPYASISAKVGKGPKSLLILGRKEGDKLHWISADRAVLVTRHGRVVRTAGFPENLRNTTQEFGDPVNKQLHNLQNSVISTRQIDLDLGLHYGIPIRSKFERIGDREITISELRVKTVLIRERNFASTVNWDFTNYYWVDAFDGFVWKSVQHIARSFPPVSIEILKPAAM